MPRHPRCDNPERQVQDGTYEYNIVGYPRFSVRNYKQGVGMLDLSKRF